MLLLNIQTPRLWISTTPQSREIPCARRLPIRLVSMRLLGVSWAVISGVISRVTMIITPRGDF